MSQAPASTEKTKPKLRASAVVRGIGAIVTLVALVAILVGLAGTPPTPDWWSLAASKTIFFAGAITAGVLSVILLIGEVMEAKGK